MEGPKQVLHMKASSHINAAEANENQRKWTKEQYDRRNDQGEKFYDWYRRHLNFEIDRDGNVRQPGYSGKINERFDRRVAELGAKPLDTRLQEKYLPNRIVRFIVSGDTEVMRRMAFGSQDVNFLYESETNSRVKRKEDIEKWAKAVHRFMCGKYGAGNIVGFDVHLDEHSPHIHCSVIPVGICTSGNGPTGKPGNWKKQSRSRATSGIPLPRAALSTRPCIPSCTNRSTGISGLCAATASAAGTSGTATVPSTTVSWPARRHRSVPWCPTRNNGWPH